MSDSYKVSLEYQQCAYILNKVLLFGRYVLYHHNCSYCVCSSVYVVSSVCILISCITWQTIDTGKRILNIGPWGQKIFYNIRPIYLLTLVIIIFINSGWFFITWFCTLHIVFRYGLLNIDCLHNLVMLSDLKTSL